MQQTTNSAARKRLALVAFSSLWLAACGGGGGGGDVVATAPAPTASSSPASSPAASGPSAPAPGPVATTPAPSAGGSAGTPAPQPAPPATAFSPFDPVVLASGQLGSVDATARLAGGGNVVLWTVADPIVPRASTLMARLTDSAGRPVGDAFAIKAEVGTVGIPAVAASPDGGFLVVWSGFDAAFDPTNQAALTQNLMARRYAADGTLLSETRLIAQPEFSFRGLSAEPLPAGGYVVGWTMQVSRMAPGWGYVQRLGSNGELAGTQVALVDNHTDSSQESIALVPGDDGALTAVWREQPGTLDNTMWISARRFDASLQPVGAATEIAGTREPFPAFETNPQTHGVAAAAAGTNVAIAWTIPRVGFSEIRSAVLAAGSATPGPVASATSTHLVNSLRAESLGGGTYGVIWQELEDYPQTISTTVNLQRHDNATGAAIGAPTQLLTRAAIPGSNGLSTIGVDAGPDGHVVVTGWTQGPSAPELVMTGR